MADSKPVWVLFKVPTPTPTRGETAKDLYDKRLTWITGAMRDSASSHGCLFHRCWYAADGSAFYAVACWATREGAGAFFDEWDIYDEEGEEAVYLEGDWGLVPVP
jgi:hypothetical protein